MKTYLISYDLHNPGRDYAEVHKAIKALANGWCHLLESLWLINCDKPASEIREAVRNAGDSNDSIYVTTLGPNWAAIGIAKSKTDWIQSYLKPDMVVNHR